MMGTENLAVGIFY